MNNHFVREFMLDDEQKTFLKERYEQVKHSLKRAKVTDTDNPDNNKGVVSGRRNCDHAPFSYKDSPDISLSLLEYIEDLDPNYPEDLWFVQYEFIKYEGVDSKFEKHNDADQEGHVRGGSQRLSTSITMIDRSEDLLGCVLKIWTPCGKEYVVDLEPFETVIFPAYYMHEATPLISGTRVVLVSWAQSGRNRG